jgi:hypothetical protein
VSVDGPDRELESLSLRLVPESAGGTSSGAQDQLGDVPWMRDERPPGVGYFRKERVGDVDAFMEAIARVAAGGSALDPAVVGRMVGRRRPAVEHRRVLAVLTTYLRSSAR